MSSYYRRAIHMVPPGAAYERHEVRGDKLIVYYCYPGITRPSFVSVML